MAIHSGGCHCGQIRFQVEAAVDLQLSECNCSICYMVGYQHLIVNRSAFKILEGEEKLVTYSFNSKVAQHYFCGNCGVKSFYVPRSHPDGISVNGRCLDPATVNSTTLKPFDGRHWEDNHHKLAPLPG